MRISDWSSDVCSSDLGLVRGTRRNLLPGRENHLTRISVDDVEGWLLSTPRFGAERNLPTAFTANEGHGVIEGVENFLAVKARSEEHTSELQSLMRISYAVFCLKTKNKTQYPHSTTYRTTTQRQNEN